MTDAPTPMPRGPAIRTLLDAIWNAGHTPRLVCALERGPVKLTGLPAFVLARYKQSNIIALDLDASYPLALEYVDGAFEANLAFQGTTARVRVPWACVAVVVDRTSDNAIAFEPEDAIVLKPPVKAGAVLPGQVNVWPTPKPAAVEVKPTTGWKPRVIPGGKK